MMTRILVPIDFSEPSRAAARYGLELAAAAGGDVVLVHVVEGLSVRRYAVGGPPQAPRDYIDPGGDFFRFPLNQKVMHRDLVEEAGWKLETLFPPGYQDRVRTLVTVGKAAEEIIRVAEEQEVDLILLGSRGQRRWWQVFRSRIASRVSRKATVPVITIDTSERHVERTPAYHDVPDRPAAGGRAAFHSDERPRTGQEREPSRYCSTVAATAEPREAAPDGPEHAKLSHSTTPAVRGGRQANERSPAVGVKG